MQQLSQDASKSNVQEFVALVSGWLAGPIAFMVALMAGLDLMNRVLGLNFVVTFLIVFPLAVVVGIALGVTMYRGWFFAQTVYPSQVYDYGDHLIVERSGDRKTVRFTEIANVGFSYLSPMRVSITLTAELEEPPIEFLPNHNIGVRKIVRSLRGRAAIS